MFIWIFERYVFVVSVQQISAYQERSLRCKNESTGTTPLASLLAGNFGNHPGRDEMFKLMTLLTDYGAVLETSDCDYRGQVLCVAFFAHASFQPNLASADERMCKLWGPRLVGGRGLA